VLVIGVGIAAGGCTRYGKPTPIPPTTAPLTTLDVNPVSGNDTTGNGTSEKPYKTLTKALEVVKASTLTGLTIQLAPGLYTVRSGEKFPIVIPTGVTINGSGYTGPSGFSSGTFVNGIGEDVALEKLLNSRSGTIFTTLEVAASVTSVSLNNVYLGVTRFGNVSSSISYSSLDTLGSVGVSHSSLGAGTPFAGHRKGVGIAVPSGNLNCVGCAIAGGDVALLAFSLPNASAPLLTLSGQPSQSVIGGGIGIATDGTAGVTGSFIVFRSKAYGYRDSVAPVASPSGSILLGTIDFGNGGNLSQGGNSFVNVGTSGISVTLPSVQVDAEGNNWTPNAQGADAHGQYPKHRIFDAGAQGPNVTIAGNAQGAAVIVGPIPPPTATPSSGPTTSPSASPT
jgi:hypothetical protein